MWTSTRELLSQFVEVNAVLVLERPFAEMMLFPMMMAAEADRPAIGGLQRNATVGPGANMSTFNWLTAAAGHAAGVGADPAAVAWADASIRLFAVPAKPLRKFHGRHWRAFSWVIEPAAAAAIRLG